MSPFHVKGETGRFNPIREKPSKQSPRMASLFFPPLTPFGSPLYTFRRALLHLSRCLFTPSARPSCIFHTPLSYLLLTSFMPFAGTKTRWRSSYDDRRTHLTTAVTQHVWRSPHACTTAAIHPLPRHNRATLTPSAVRQYCPKPQPHPQNNNKTG